MQCRLVSRVQCWKLACTAKPRSKLNNSRHCLHWQAPTGQPCPSPPQCSHAAAALQSAAASPLHYCINPTSSIHQRGCFETLAARRNPAAEQNALCYYDSKTPHLPPQMPPSYYLTAPKAPTLQSHQISNAWYEMAVLHPPAWLCSMQILLPRRKHLGQSQIEETNCTEKSCKKVQRPPKQSKVRSLHAGQHTRQAKATKQQVCD